MLVSPSKRRLKIFVCSGSGCGFGFGCSGADVGDAAAAAAGDDDGGADGYSFLFHCLSVSRAGQERMHRQPAPVGHCKTAPVAALERWPWQLEQLQQLEQPLLRPELGWRVAASEARAPPRVIRRSRSSCHRCWPYPECPNWRRCSASGVHHHLHLRRRLLQPVDCFPPIRCREFHRSAAAPATASPWSRSFPAHAQSSWVAWASAFA